MNDYTQYTIRKVPKEIDTRLKAQAKKRGLSLNKLLLDKLGALPKQNTKPKIHHDLDFLIGSMSDQEADDLWRVVKEAREIDKKFVEAEFKASRAQPE